MTNKCEHGKWRWQACDECVAAITRERDSLRAHLQEAQAERDDFKRKMYHEHIVAENALRELEQTQASAAAMREALDAVVGCVGQPNPTNLKQWMVSPQKGVAFGAAIEKAHASLVLGAGKELRAKCERYEKALRRIASRGSSGFADADHEGILYADWANEALNGGEG